jgi:hypothetical protein
MEVRHLSTKRAVLGLALAAVCTAAIAAVTFDPFTGLGFVGKGDVQLAYGWNNAQLQTNAAGVTFSYGHEESYTAVCTWTTAEGKLGERIHNVPHKKKISVNSDIAYDNRTNKRQITGFNLKGFGDTFTESGTVPVVGGHCHNESGGGTGGTWTSVTANGDLAGGVYANYGGASILLP